MLPKVLQQLFESTKYHREKHECGGYPYEHGDVLMTLVAALRPKRVLEIGTALGFTTVCLALGCADTKIETIDQDPSHLEKAKENFTEFGITDRIMIHSGKAEGILATLSPEFDLIFFDAYVPSMKFLTQFERLLKRNGVLITANMFLRDATGGKYMRALSKPNYYKTGVFADTTISVRL